MEGGLMRKSCLKGLLLPVILIFILSQTACRAGDQAAIIDDIVAQYVESGDIHGSVLVAEQGTVLYEKAFGTANLEWDIPNEVDTRYRIYSMSKQFTALLVMQQVEEGKIDVHQPITTYLPYYRRDVGDRVTVHHLLSHTHGIAEHYERLPAFLVPEPTRELVETYFSNELDFEPGSQWRYSGLLGYILLGAIVESVTGQPYEQVLQERILDPAGMVHTTYLDYHRLIPKRAADYRRTENGIEHRIQAYPMRADGATAIVSTVGDIMRWDQALYDNTLLSKEYQDEIFTPQVAQYAPYYYGYGWYIADLDFDGEEKRIHYHTGGGGCIIFRSPMDRQTILILGNLRSDKLYDIGLEILTAIQADE
jgi:CubicO group peptidase (beta-lactamase class C family)